MRDGILLPPGARRSLRERSIATNSKASVAGACMAPAAGAFCFPREVPEMTIVETAMPAGAPMPLPLSNGADDGRAASGETGTAGLVVVARPHRPPIRRYSHDFVEKVRLAYEQERTPIKTLAARFGIGQGTIQNWSTKYDWTRPDGAPPLQGPRRRYGSADQRRELVARLHRTFGRQLAALEKRAKDGGGETLEKDARTLGVLAKTLETLIELDRDDGAKVGEPEPVDRDVEELDADLAARIAEWAAGGAET